MISAIRKFRYSSWFYLLCFQRWRLGTSTLSYSEWLTTNLKPPKPGCETLIYLDTKKVFIFSYKFNVYVVATVSGNIHWAMSILYFIPYLLIQRTKGNAYLKETKHLLWFYYLNWITRCQSLSTLMKNERCKCGGGYIHIAH